jgi:hypothetical protein
VATVNFTVIPKDGTKAFKIEVDMKDVTITNGKGSVPLDPAQHKLVWRFAGNPGSKLAIVGAVGAKKVVEVKQSTIPPGFPVGAGVKTFKV